MIKKGAQYLYNSAASQSRNGAVLAMTTARTFSSRKVVGLALMSATGMAAHGAYKNCEESQRLVNGMHMLFSSFG